MSIANTVDIFIFRLFLNLQPASLSDAFSPPKHIEPMTIIHGNR